MRCRLHGLGVKDVQIHGRRTEYRICVVQMSCVGCLPWLPGGRYHFSSTGHFGSFIAFGFASSFSDLTAASLNCVQLCVSSWWSSSRLCFVSLSVTSSLTSGLFSESNKCYRGTQGRRVQRHQIRQAYAKQRTANTVIMA